jgi:hypothetical protein
LRHQGRVVIAQPKPFVGLRAQNVLMCGDNNNNNNKFPSYISHNVAQNCRLFCGNSLHASGILPQNSPNITQHSYHSGITRGNNGYPCDMTIQKWYFYHSALLSHALLLWQHWLFSTNITIIKSTGHLTKDCISKDHFSLVCKTVNDPKNYIGYTGTTAIFSVPHRCKDSGMIKYCVLRSGNFTVGWITCVQKNITHNLHKKMNLMNVNYTWFILTQISNTSRCSLWSYLL